MRMTIGISRLHLLGFGRPGHLVLFRTDDTVSSLVSMYASIADQGVVLRGSVGMAI
jgi:hypothetical protein